MISAKNFYYIMISVLIFSILGGAVSIYFGNAIMHRSAEQLVAAKLDNLAAEAEEQSFLQAKKDLEKYSDLHEIIQNVLPKTKDQALAVKELYRIGDETGIVIDSIQFPASTLGQAKKTTTAASASAVVTQAKPVQGLTGVMGIDVEIGLKPSKGISISYDNMLRFLEKVEANRRNMQIKRISVNADTKNGGISFNATVTIFVKP